MAQMNAAGESRAVYLLMKLVARALCTRWVDGDPWIIGKPIPNSCVEARLIAPGAVDRAKPGDLSAS